MFNRHKQKQKKKQQRAEPLESLSLTPEGTLCLKKQLNQIQQLIGVTQTDFTLLYETSVIHFLDYMSEPNQRLEADMIENQLAPIILALKRRRGYLLPLGADSEVVFREREAWTFAVFSAALLKQCDESSRMALGKALLPKQSYDWLQRNLTLFSLWQRYLQGDTKTVFSSIVEQASLPDQTETATVAPVKAKTSNTTSTTDSVIEVGMMLADDVMQSVIQKRVDDTAVVNRTTSKATHTPVKPESVESEENVKKSISEIDLKTLNTKTTKVETHDSPVTPIIKQKREAVAEKQTQASQQTIPTFEAATFWRWLKSVLADNAIEANQAESIVHGVNQGLFVRIPEAVDAFIQTKAEQRGFSAEQAIWQQRPGLIKKIKKHERLIKHTNNSRFHDYYLGEWEARQRLSGVVISADELLNNPGSIPINEQLKIDLIES